jgi:Icc-related predicted phosphoesterase
MYDPNVKGPEYVHPDADVIVLAGDIAEPDVAYSIVNQYRECNKPVLYVAGNHDHWNSTLDEAKAKRKRLFEGTNITELDMECKVIGDVAFVGATLWTDLSSPTDANIARQTKDFRLIKDMTPEKWDYLHRHHRDYIRNVCIAAHAEKKKSVVITHYLPSFRCCPERYKDDPTNCIFASNLDHLMDMEAAPHLWIHGHTHDSFDWKNGNTRVICNPFGYWGHMTNKEYKPDLLVEI